MTSSGTRILASDNNMEEEAHLIEYSDVKNVRDGQRQTNIIPGGPQPPTYSGMNAAEKVLAKAEYTKKRTQTIHRWAANEAAVR